MEQPIQAVAKVRFVNLETLEERAAQFNPAEFSKSIGVDWKRYAVAGLGYEPILYTKTGNQEFSLTLPFRVTRPAEKEEFEQFSRFIEACCYPTAPGSSPPDVLLVWPGVVAVPCKVSSCSSQYLLFNKEGHPTRADIALSLFWVRRQALLAGDIRQFGSVA